MKTKLSLLFYLKKPRNYQDGSIPIYLRVTVDGKRSEIATGRECEPKVWNAAAGRMFGNKEVVKSLNAYLGNLEQQFLDAQASLVREGELATAESIKNRFLGIVTDFDIRRIDFAFIEDYEFYLRSVRKMGNNAVVKHMKMFRKIVNIYLGNGWISLDPYLNFKGKFKKLIKQFLPEKNWT